MFHSKVRATKKKGGVGEESSFLLYHVYLDGLQQWMKARQSLVSGINHEPEDSSQRKHNFWTLWQLRSDMGALCKKCLRNIDRHICWTRFGLND